MLKLALPHCRRRRHEDIHCLLLPDSYSPSPLPQPLLPTPTSWHFILEMLKLALPHCRRRRHEDIHCLLLPDSYSPSPLPQPLLPTPTSWHFILEMLKLALPHCRRRRHEDLHYLLLPDSYSPPLCHNPCCRHRHDDISKSEIFKLADIRNPQIYPYYFTAATADNQTSPKTLYCSQALPP